jgi:carboxypeptidase Q
VSAWEGARSLQRIRAGGLTAWFAAAVLGATAAPLPAQVAPLSSAETLDALDRIREEGLERSQIMETLSWLTDIHGGRLTNSPSMLRSMKWIETRIASWDIQRVWRESWGPFGYGWTNERVWIRGVEPEPFTIIGTAEAWTGSTDGLVRGPAVLLGGIESEADLEPYRGRLQGAFVLVAEAPRIQPPQFEPQASRHSAEDLIRASWPFRSDGAAPDSVRMAQIRAEFQARQRLRAVGLEFFASEGAAAVVVAGRGTGGTVFLDNTYLGMNGPQNPARIPVLTFASEHYGRIVRTLKKNVPVVLEAHIVNTLHGTTQDHGFNLLAEIPGAGRPDEVVMFGAHLDGFHFATSATDNGVNVATMMEALRILRSTGVPLHRTVRLALWTGEEQGLLGSKAYVHEHFIDSLTNVAKPAHARLAAYYNLDNGGGAIRGAMADWGIQPNMQVDSTFRAWTRLLHPALGLEVVAARGGGGTDHVSFYTRGLPGFQFMQDWLEYWTRTSHSNMDVYERVVEDDVKRNAVIVASFLLLTANQEALFPRTVTRPR